MVRKGGGKTIFLLLAGIPGERVASPKRAFDTLSPKDPQEVVQRMLSRFKYLPRMSGVSLLFALLLGIYTFFFLESLPRWFHPGWTTDDALQQWFPLHEVLTPGIFSGDLISETMSGYLAPLHYGVCVLATYLTGDVVMASHWVMLVQLLLTVVFLFLAVRSIGGVPAALLSVFWLFHTRQIVQRLTAGLPRGWSAVVITAFFYFAFKRNHLGVLIVLALGCLSHPPTTLICGLAYGLWLTYEALICRRQAYRTPFLVLVVLSPAFAFMTYKVVERPAEVGQMVAYEEASQLPQFQYPDGRFPFLPHPKIQEDIHTFAFQAFTGRFYKPPKFFRKYIRELVVVVFLLLLLVGYLRKREPLPPIVGFFLFSIAVVYLLSRPLAFQLYVPNRHLQFPMALFWIVSFPPLVWRSLSFANREQQGRWWQRTSIGDCWLGAVGLLALAGLVWIGSGDGLKGDANFNYSSTKKGNLFLWAEKNTDPHALFAGHPKLIDGMMLFGNRRAFATNETYHPFYSGYRSEMERRLEITFKAHYAKSLQELYEVLAPEKVDYFVFDRRKFYPDELASEEYYPPLADLVKALTSYPPSSYAYKELPREVTADFPPLVYRDDYAAIVDIHKLGEWLRTHPGTQEQQSPLPESSGEGEHE